MYTNDSISKIASKIFSAAVEVKYTTKGNPAHVFKKGRDTVSVYDSPKAVKRFNVVLSGKDWDDGANKTILRLNENGSSSFSTGREDASLGQPVVWASLPANLKKVIMDQVGGKWEE